MSVNSSAATPASSNRRARSTTGTSDTSAQPSVATMPSLASTATTMPLSNSRAMSFDEFGVLERGRAHHDARHARIEPAFDILPHCGCRRPVGHGPERPRRCLHRLAILRRASEGAVQVDHVQMLRPGLGKQHRLRCGIVAINGGAVHIAFGQAHDLRRLSGRWRERRSWPPLQEAVEQAAGRSSGSFPDGIARPAYCRARPLRPVRRRDRSSRARPARWSRGSGRNGGNRPRPPRPPHGRCACGASATSFQPICGTLTLHRSARSAAPRPRSSPSPGVTPCSSPRVASNCMPTQMPRNGAPPTCTRSAMASIMPSIARKPCGTRAEAADTGQARSGRLRAARRDRR